jgi:hypothetical protein
MQNLIIPTVKKPYFRSQNYEENLELERITELNEDHVSSVYIEITSEND